MRELGVYKNIPVSDTKLTLGLRVGSISSQLTADKLFPVNPRAIPGPQKMSLLLEVKSTPELIVKPRFILVTHTDDLGRYITRNQQGQMLVQNLNMIVSRPNITPRSGPPTEKSDVSYIRVKIPCNIYYIYMSFMIDFL